MQSDGRSDSDRHAAGVPTLDDILICKKSFEVNKDVLRSP